MTPKLSKLFEVHFRFLHFQDYNEAFPGMSCFKQLMACNNQVLLHFTFWSCKHLASPSSSEICSNPKRLTFGAPSASPFTLAGTGCSQEPAHCKGEKLLCKHQLATGRRGCSGTMALEEAESPWLPAAQLHTEPQHPASQNKLLYAVFQ